MKGFGFRQKAGGESVVEIVDLDEDRVVFAWGFRDAKQAIEIASSLCQTMNEKLRSASSPFSIDEDQERPSPAPAPAPERALPRLGLEPSLEDLVSVMERKGFDVFGDSPRDFNLNIVGIRDSGARLDRFSCRLVVFWTFAGETQVRRFTITTLPGSRYLVDKLLSRKGCAILVPGQYRGVYALDMHLGKYEALCQRGGTVRVYRDGDRDRFFDTDPDAIEGGWFGINIHAPVTPRDGLADYVKSKVVGSSAGCQVFERMADFYEFRDLCRNARSHFGNSFTYTLLESKDVLS